MNVIMNLTLTSMLIVALKKLYCSISECNCNHLGSVNLVCDYRTGQCPCHSNVATAGQLNTKNLENDNQCQACRKEHFGFFTGQGCQPCNCDRTGSNSSECDDNGQCSCKPTIGGEKCSLCLPGYYMFGSNGCRYIGLLITEGFSFL